MPVRHCLLPSPWILSRPLLMLMLGCLLAALSCLAQAEVLLRVGLYENMPKIGIADNGRPQGIFIDLLASIAASESWRIEYVPGTWNEGLARLAAGEIDLMPDVAITTERERLYRFPREPVLLSWSRIYARKGSGIHNLPDLRDKRIAVLEGAVQQEQLRQMVSGFELQLQVLPFADYATAFRAAADNRVDAVVTNRFYGIRHAADFGLEETAIIFNPSRQFFAARQGIDPALLTALDRRLSELKQTPKSDYFRTLEHWTGDKPLTVLPPWLIWSSLGALSLFAAAALWGLLLRREVRARTAQLDRRNGEITAMNRTLRATASSLSTPTILDEALRGVLQMTGFDGGVICLRDADSGALRVGAHLHRCAVTDRTSNGQPLGDASCPAMLAESFKRGQPVLRSTDSTDGPAPCANVRDGSVRWNAYFPLQAQGRMLGVICLHSAREAVPEQRVLDLAQEVCGPVALALDNVRLYGEVRQHAEALEQRVAQRTHELAETSGRLDALLRQIPIPVFYRDRDLRFRGCNRAYEVAFGVSQQQLVGKTVDELEFLPFEERERIKRLNQQVLVSGEAIHGETIARFADGKPHQTLFSLDVLRDPEGATSGLIGIIVDITEQKEAEAALRAAEERQRGLAEELNRILECSVDAICVFDETLNFLRVSPACMRLWGYRPEQLVGTNYLDHIPVEEHAATLAAAQSMLGGGAPRALESRFRRQDGSHAFVNWTAVWSAEDRLWYCIARDDSERRRLLGELQSRNAELLANAEELARARDAAQAADRIKSAFLATMSHELRTPLNSIIGFTGILLQELAGPLGDEQRKQLTMVQNSARHLLALINDVLDISKIEAGELKIGHQAFDLRQAIDKVVTIVGPLADGKGLSMQVAIDESLGAMTGDSRRVEQILLNLLGNAIKFTDAGSIALRAEAVAGYATERDAPPVPAVRVRISDTGIGIKDEDMALLFQPFRQVETTIARVHEGTGLGLAICRKLTRLMGGRIEAHSRWGEGSEFIVTLPLHCQSNNPSPSPQEPGHG